MLFKVADIPFRLVSSHEEALWSRMGNYHPFTAEENREEQAVFTISLDGKVDLPEEPPLKTFEYDITDDKAILRIYPQRYILSINNSRRGDTFFLDCPLPPGEREGLRFTSDAASKGYPPPPHILDHFIIQAFGFAGVRHNALLIHASTVVYREQAVMFLAESGTGKSTHTRLWLENIPGTSLLNDDAPAARIVEGRVIAYGTPWSGKTPCYRNERYPLAACARIRRAPYNRIERQPTIAAFGALLPSCLPTLQQDDDMLDGLCSVISGILDLTPVYILDCLPDADAARVSSSTIFS